MSDPFGWGEIIATAALLVSLVGWFDSRRRISHSEVSFAVERTDDPTQYLIRHTGTKTVKNARLDVEPLARYEVDGLAFSPKMRPGDSITFWLTASHGFLPKDLEIRFGRRGVRVIAFPQSASEHPAS